MSLSKQGSYFLTNRSIQTPIDEMHEDEEDSLNEDLRVPDEY